jgi:choline dehydrogenase-like flavoprotein
MSNETQASPSQDQADVVIIGAGPAGSIAAHELARQGLSVVALEQGFYPEREKYPGREPEWELISQKAYNSDPNIRDNPQDYPINNSESDIHPLMYAGVGGSTVIYNAQWAPLLPSDYRLRTLDGVADDWPISYEDVEPYLEEVERLIGVSGVRGNPAYPPRQDFPLPPIPLGEASRKAIKGFDGLGWHWWPAAYGIASVPYNGLNGCVRRGTCHVGCAEGAKSTADLNLWPQSIKHNARLITGARVREIEVDENGLASGVVYIDRAGRTKRQKAKAVVLAANTIGTARLLLLSKSGRFPNGLANSSGLVGKRLMLHPYSGIVGSFPDNLQSWRGPFGNVLESYQFYETDKSRGFVRGARWSIVPSGGPLSVSSVFGSKVLDANNFEASWGEALHKNVERRLGRTLIVGIIGEDLPLETNRVELDETLTDSDGIPAPKVIYRTDENSRALLRFHEERAVEFLKAAGAVEIQVASQLQHAGWHILGTARMGSDPETSVVNEWGQSHDVPNLFLVGASVFVTSGGVNPTASVAALSLRTARHIAENRRNLEVA